jgi:hypothetical protein
MKSLSKTICRNHHASSGWHHLGMPGAIISEPRALSSRNTRAASSERALYPLRPTSSDVGTILLAGAQAFF